ncbi:MAG: phosphate ABC transporter permease PstA [Planctomycetota bacterium]
MIQGRSQEMLDNLLSLFVWLTAIFFSLLFLLLLGEIVQHGWEKLSWSFLTQSPESAGRSGGINSVLFSTFWILLICLGTCVPLGLGTAIFLAEFVSPYSRIGTLIRFSLDLLASVPSIVFGLFGNAFFGVYLGMGFSLVSGGLTLACMSLPLFARTVEASLRLIPQSYRLSASALGLTRTETLLYLLLPLALPGIFAGFVLSVGRSLSETAALIFTSGYVLRTPESIWDSGRSLSVHIYDLSMNVPGGESSAYATALVLIFLLLLIHLCFSWGLKYFKESAY